MSGSLSNLTRLPNVCPTFIAIIIFPYKEPLPSSTSDSTLRSPDFSSTTVFSSTTALSIHTPLAHPAHLSSRATPCKAESICSPHPTHEAFEHVLHVTLRHMSGNRLRWNYVRRTRDYQKGELKKQEYQCSRNCLHSLFPYFS